MNLNLNKITFYFQQMCSVYLRIYVVFFVQKSKDFNII